MSLLLRLVALHKAGSRVQGARGVYTGFLVPRSRVLPTHPGACVRLLAYGPHAEILEPEEARAMVGEVMAGLMG